VSAETVRPEIPTDRQRSRASAIGGIATGIAIFILSLLLAGGLSWTSIAIAVVIGASVGVWVRLADL
jgi:hypothetical protein